MVESLRWQLTILLVLLHIEGSSLVKLEVYEVHVQWVWVFREVDDPEVICLAQIVDIELCAHLGTVKVDSQRVIVGILHFVYHKVPIDDSICGLRREEL